MAVNVYPVSGATEIQFYNRNYTYANALTDLPDISMIIFSDLNVLGFADTLGNVKKCLCDASGASTAITDSIFFSNSSGEADTTATLQWDGTDILVDSNPVHHDGKDTITLTNGGHTATIALDAAGRLAIEIDGIEQTSWANGGPE